MPQPIFHLESIIEKCEIRVRLNGLPIIRQIASGEEAEWYAPPINLYVIGQGNQVDIDVYPPIDDAGNAEDLTRAVLDFAVRQFEAGEAVAPGVGNAIAEHSFASELADRIREAQDQDVELPIPQQFSFQFDNTGPSSASELSDADTFDDEEALRDYAIHLRDLLVARDLNGLMSEMEPKVQAYASAFDHDADPIRESLRGVLRNDFLPSTPQTDFERSDVEVQSCCGGRIWSLQRAGQQPLFQTLPDADGGTMQFEILVAPRDGQLRIVR